MMLKVIICFLGAHVVIHGRRFNLGGGESKSTFIAVVLSNILENPGGGPGINQKFKGGPFPPCTLTMYTRCNGFEMPSTQ
jgi:hypothetical protein